MSNDIAYINAILKGIGSPPFEDIMLEYRVEREEFLRREATQAKWDARKRRMALNKKLEQGIETPKRARL